MDIATALPGIRDLMDYLLEKGADRVEVSIGEMRLLATFSDKLTAAEWAERIGSAQAAAVVESITDTRLGEEEIKEQEKLLFASSS